VCFEVIIDSVEEIDIIAFFNEGGCRGSEIEWTLARAKEEL